MPSKTTTASKRTSSLLKKKQVKPKTKRAKTPKAKTPKSSRKKATSRPSSPTKEKKTRKEEKKSKRKINMNPTLSDKAGLNISVARVKNIVDAFILNREEFVAAQEVRKAYHPTEKDESGGEKKLPSVPISNLSEETQDLIEKAKYFYDRSQKEEWEKKKVDGMTESNRTAYLEARKTAKDEFEDGMRLVPEFERGVFDVEAFNKSYDKHFYKGFTETASEDDEWQVALSQLSKLRVRFSANSKILLSSFIELLLRQLAVNGTYNCIQGKKKIIKLSHALITNEHTDGHFPLFPLVANTKVYRKFVSTQAKPTSEDDQDEEEPEEETHPEDDSRPNFRFYVSEICRDVRMKLASETLKVEADPTEDKEVYNLTNVSRDFKDFCNELIFETVNILGRMILTEINTRGVKTLNDVIMKTVIEHLHSAYGLDFRSSLVFIESATTQYNSFVKKRREDRKASPSAADEGYDVEYAEE